MVCKKCKTILPDEAKFCTKCGRTVQTTRKKTGKNSRSKPRKKTQSIRLIVTVCLTLAIIAGAFAVWFFWDADSERTLADKDNKSASMSADKETESAKEPEVEASEEQIKVSPPVVEENKEEQPQETEGIQLNNNGSEDETHVDSDEQEVDNGSVEKQQIEWTEWMDSIPDTVSGDDYLIESRTMYRSKQRETTTSTTDQLDGWELVDVVSSGEYGSWSEWSTVPVEANDSRDVEQQQQYRYRELEKKDSPVELSGWVLYDTTEVWSDYGNWNDWTTSDSVLAMKDSPTTEIETKTQYSYRDQISTSNTEYGSWSSWQDSKINASDSLEVETRTVVTGTEYYLVHYCTGPNCGTHSYFTSYTSNTNDSTFNSKCSYHELGWINESEVTASSGNGNYWEYETGHESAYTYGDHKCGNGCYLWYIDDTRDITKTQYRSRQVIETTKQEWSAWTEYSDAVVSPSSSRDVRTQTLYRHRVRSLEKTYHYSRWGEWSDWTTQPMNASNERQVEERICYRYRDVTANKTYQFQRWGEWSNYSTKEITPSDTVQVETRTQYRYKSK